jgi:hypothetical protein
MAFSEADPFTEPDALLEAQLLDVRFEVLTSTIGLLFEFRTAMNFMEGNTALLVARGAREFKWAGEARPTSKTAWNVVGSAPVIANGLFVLELDFLPLAQARLVAKRVEFYVGDVASLDDQLPDYLEDDDATVRANLASWRSLFSPLQAMVIEAVT